MDMIKQFSTMCKNFNSPGDYVGCPLYKKLAEVGLEHNACLAYVTAHPEEVSEIVQEWFYHNIQVMDLIDRTPLLNMLRNRWANSNHAKEEVLLFLEFEEMVQAQPKVLPPAPADSSESEEPRKMSDVHSFKQHYLSVFPDCRKLENGYPDSLPCHYYGQLRPCLTVCNNECNCEDCWDTPMLDICIKKRVKEMEQTSTKE